MTSFFTKFKLVVRDANLRRRIFFTLGMLAVFRLFAAIPIPGIDTLQFESFLAQNQFLGLFNLFSGGGLDNLSIVMLGVGPYITGSIIMQLFTMMSPRLKSMYHEEGETGRRKFSQYSRLLTVPLAIVQGWAFLLLLEQSGAVGALSSFEMAINVLIIATGSIVLMWLGELITEFGIGNGISLIIFAGIVSRLPVVASQLWFTYFAAGFDPSILPMFIGFAIAAIVIIAGIVTMTEAERPVPVTYAKQVRGSKVYGGASTYLPLRLNQAGVIPIIFAISILLLPQMIANFLERFENDMVHQITTFIMTTLSPTGLVYGVLYFALVVMFTYFYTALTFEPDTIASNLQKSGAFIPGVRPGNSTAEHLGRIVTRITLVGSLFLGIVAVLPLVVQSITHIAALAIGGTALLIVVQVVLDLIRKIDAQISMREY
jgi:preprotein translocase subunit SecY